MRFENGGGNAGVHAAQERALHGLGLFRIWNARENGFAAQNLPDGHGDGLFGHFVYRAKPALLHLLRLAALVQRNHDVGFFRLEIGWRIVKGDMGILADANQAHMDRAALQQGAYFGGMHRIPGHVMRLYAAHFVHKPLLQVFLKTGAMVFR